MSETKRQMPNVECVPFLALGMLSIGAQTLIAREFLASFGGNEVLIALFYFFWLFWVGIGAVIARRVPSPADPLWEALIYPLLVFVELLLFIGARHLIPTEAWELVTAPKALPVLAAATALVSLKTGTLFVRLTERFQKHENRIEIIGKAYIGESAGSFLGGMLLTLGTWSLSDPFVILGLLVILYLALLWPFSTLTRPKLRKPALTLIMMAFVMLTVLHTPINRHLQQLRGIFLPPDAALLDTVYTPYRHLNFFQSQGRMIMTADGVIAGSYPETVSTDRDIALLMAAARPRRVLLLGIGVENMIARLLRYPVESIVWVQPDRRYFDAFIEHSPPSLAAAFVHDRVNVIIQPPRQFLARGSDRFDLIVSAAGSPSTLAVNSFYTREFIDQCRQRLSSDGVLAASLDQEENFLNDILAWYGSSFYRSMSSVFPHVSVVPGKVHWFLASTDADAVRLDADNFKYRFRNTVSAGTDFPAEGFDSLLEPRRIDQLRDRYEEVPESITTTLVNSDRRPATFLINNMVFLSLSGIPAAEIYATIAPHATQLLAAVLIVFLLLRIIYIRRSRTPTNEFNIRTFQTLSGFSSMTIYLILLFMYQNRHGTMALTLGLWSGLYMLGLALGAGLASRLPQRLRNPLVVLIVQFTLPVLILLLPPAAQLTFAAMFLGAGITGGMSYPVAAAVFRTDTCSALSSTLTMLDHWGAALGGLLGGLLLLPLVGIDATLSLLALSAAGLIVLYRLPGPGTHPIHLHTILDRAPAFIIAGMALTALTFSYPYRHDSNAPDRILENRDNTIVIDSNDIPGVEGYGGAFTLTIRLNDARRIDVIELTRHRETAAYIDGKLRPFLDQFIGRPIDVELTRDSIDAMTGATVTSNAVINAVNAAAGFSPVYRPTHPTLIPFLLLTAAALFVYRRLRSSRTARMIVLVSSTLAAGILYNLTFSLTHLERLLTADIPSREMFFIATVIVLTLVFGRFYCGWLCPFGALQELAGATPLRTNIPDRLEVRLRPVKYIVLLMIVTAIVFQATSLFGHEPLTIAFATLPFMTAGKILVILITAGSIVYQRIWCRVFCPIGAFFALISHFFQLARFKSPKRCPQCPYNVTDYRDPECIQCNTCLNEPPVHRLGAGPALPVIALVTLTGVVFFIPVLTSTKIKRPVLSVSFPADRFRTTGITAPLDTIQERIRCGKLSNHESVFYER